MIFFGSPVYLILVLPLSILLLRSLIFFAAPPKFNPPSLRFYEEVKTVEAVKSYGIGYELLFLFIGASSCLMALSQPQIKLDSGEISFSAIFIIISIVSFIIWYFIYRWKINSKAELKKTYDAIVPSLPCEDIGLGSRRWQNIANNFLIFSILALILLAFKLLISNG